MYNIQTTQEIISQNGGSQNCHALKLTFQGSQNCTPNI